MNKYPVLATLLLLSVSLNAHDYLTPVANPAQYQWGLHAMDFPKAWEITKGNAYVGIADGIGWAAVEGRPEFSGVRKQFSLPGPVLPIDTTPAIGVDIRSHGVHIAGIVGANGSTGIWGACPNCSLLVAPTGNDVQAFHAETVAASIRTLVSSGSQVINMSWSGSAESGLITNELGRANRRDVLLVGASGNDFYYKDPHALDSRLRYLDAPYFPARLSYVLSVGGASLDSAVKWIPMNRYVDPGCRTQERINNGLLTSHSPGDDGVMAPSTKILSTYIPYSRYGFTGCAHSDEFYGDDFIPGDGVGILSGTSMSAAYVSSLGALIRSINPLLSSHDVKKFILDGADLSGASTTERYSVSSDYQVPKYDAYNDAGSPSGGMDTNSFYADYHLRFSQNKWFCVRGAVVYDAVLSGGSTTHDYYKCEGLHGDRVFLINKAGSSPYCAGILVGTGGNFECRLPKNNRVGQGMANAYRSVQQAVNTNPSLLTPLFSFYSEQRKDYFYTTVPQMAISALNGELMPKREGTSGVYVPVGNGVVNYSRFPSFPRNPLPLAEVWVFTTDYNPMSSSVPLAPLYRLSWKCGDSTRATGVCAANTNNMDVTYTADLSEKQLFISQGYQLDGIEGYIYPKHLLQPQNTVKLVRRYNSVNDDYAIFPETKINEMAAKGYIENIGTEGSDWLGYVYLNNGSSKPSYISVVDSLAGPVPLKPASRITREVTAYPEGGFSGGVGFTWDVIPGASRYRLSIERSSTEHGGYHLSTGLLLNATDSRCDGSRTCDVLVRFSNTYDSPKPGDIRKIKWRVSAEINGIWVSSGLENELKLKMIP